MQTGKRQVFSGTLSSDTDDFLLLPPGGDFVKVDFFFQPGLEEFVTSNKLDQHQQVSILGHLGVDPRLGQEECVIAEKVVSHNDIAGRAFEIYKSARGRSALDNWLSAERQLLGI
jgi:hypothetical protein